MTVRIFPTENDVGGGGLGKIGKEDNISGILAAPWHRNFVIEGFHLLSCSYSTFNITVSAGKALISGYRYELEDSQTFTVNASETDATWYLQLTTSGGLVTGIQWVRVISPALDGSDDPVDSIPIVTVTTDATRVTGISWGTRLGKGMIYGSYTGNGVYGANENQEISLGQFRPFIILVTGLGTTSKGKIIAFSQMLDVPPLVGGVDIFGIYFEDCPIYGTRIGMADWTNPIKIPVIRADQPVLSEPLTYYFKVSVQSSEANLNENNEVYTYLAIAS